MVICQYCDEAKATKELIYSTTGAKAWYCDECAKDTGMDEFDKEMSQKNTSTTGEQDG